MFPHSDLTNVIAAPTEIHTIRINHLHNELFGECLLIHKVILQTHTVCLRIKETSYSFFNFFSSSCVIGSWENLLDQANTRRNTCNLNHLHSFQTNAKIDMEIGEYYENKCIDLFYTSSLFTIYHLYIAHWWGYYTVVEVMINHENMDSLSICAKYPFSMNETNTR